MAADRSNGEAAGDQFRPRVVAFVHFCAPDVGSEAAAGWGVVQAISGTADVTAFVHERYIEAVQHRLQDEPNEHLRFVGVPMPRWGGRLDKIGVRAITQPVWFARFLAWHWKAKRLALTLHAESPFDVAIHPSGAYWLPSPFVDLPIPTVWGPVGGAERSPPQLRRHLASVGAAKESVDLAVKALVSLNPWTRRALWRSTVRIAETDSTLRRMPRRLQPTIRIANRSILTDRFAVPEIVRQQYVAFSSPLEPRKGPALAVHALAHTPDSVRLVFIHRGPEEQRLRRLAAKLGVDDRVEFRGRVSRDEMRRVLGEAAAMVFTGLYEAGGCALAEAMLAGTPVVLLGHAGARVVAEAATDPDRIAMIEPGDAEETARRLGEAMARFSASPPKARSPYLDQDGTRKALQKAVEDAIALHKSS